MKKKWRCAVLAVLTGVMLLGGCGGKKELNTGDERIRALTPSEGETVALVNPDIVQFLKNYEMGSSDKYVTHTDNFAPKGIKLSWSADDEPTEYLVSVDTDKNFSSPKTYTVSENRIVLRDLFVNYTYYWKVTAKYETEERTSKYFSFSTANTPRTIQIEGVSNTRDIGGKLTANAKKVKQGMVYRGAYLDEIKESGTKKALATYAIKTDLDLRRNAEGLAGNGSPLGESVRYFNYSCPYYWGGENGIDNAANYENLANCIRVFADESNYPVFVHCSVGRDRTSMVVMLLEGLLGVSEEDIFIDYEMSAFSYRGSGTLDGAKMSQMVDEFHTTYVHILVRSEERNFQAACEAYLLSIGVTQLEIDNIKQILLEN